MQSDWLLGDDVSSSVIRWHDMDESSSSSSSSSSVFHSLAQSILLPEIASETLKDRQLSLILIAYRISSSCCMPESRSLLKCINAPITRRFRVYPTWLLFTCCVAWSFFHIQVWEAACRRRGVVPIKYLSGLVPLHIDILSQPRARLRSQGQSNKVAHHCSNGSYDRLMVVDWWWTLISAWWLVYRCDESHSSVQQSIQDQEKKKILHEGYISAMRTREDRKSRSQGSQWSWSWSWSWSWLVLFTQCELRRYLVDSRQ